MSNDIKRLIVMFIVFVVGVANHIWSNKRNKDA